MTSKETLSAVALPDELEVVAWDFSEIEHILDETFHFASTSPGAQENINHVLDILRREPLVTLSQAHSTIAALRAQLQHLGELASAHRDELEAQVKRLTEEKEALRKGKTEIAMMAVAADGQAQEAYEKLSVAEARIKALEEAAARIKPYLVWTIGDESPGHHPTMPSAVDAFLAALNSRKKAE